MQKALYIDIDGTLARFHDADKAFIEAMWTPGFYISLKPFENLVAAIKLFIKDNPDVEVYVLSAVLDTEPPFVVDEKNQWLDIFLPEIDREHRIFTRAGEDKSSYLDMKGKECYLLDDYNKNLYEFVHAGGRGIKFHNNVNHRGLGAFGGSKGNLWQGDIVHFSDNPVWICKDLEKVVCKEKIIGEIYYHQSKESVQYLEKEADYFKQRVIDTLDTNQFIDIYLHEGSDKSWIYNNVSGIGLQKVEYKDFVNPPKSIDEKIDSAKERSEKNDKEINFNEDLEK